ncbi:MAG TPA: DUF4190 domain-containing protein [Candidatus Agrococcus pullicola]|uniref:DUF4190 domain-containing protein n=1 Tax=Candidatus Agrococcus pullicola TaxID=2838429 RepID=A0A9D1YUQ4_9MICO|nr:DUF4190 domain-containing protein [Candidatus Agrococcus pullicola]
MTYDPNNPYANQQQSPQQYGNQQPYGHQYGQYSIGGSGQYQYGDTSSYMNAAQSVQTKTNVMAIISLVLGSVSFALSFGVVLWLISLLIGVAGLILGFIGMSKAKSYGSGKGVAIAGIITNALGILGSLFWAFMSLLLFVPLL